MIRLRLWLLIVPLVAAGTQFGATLVDRFAPASYESAELFGRSNASHGQLPLAICLGAAAVICAVWWLAASAPSSRRLPGWAFACLPLGLFALQEHIEYVIAHGHVPWLLATNPMFLLGLALQLPIAAVAYFAARLLVDVAVSIAERRTGTPPPVDGQRLAPVRPCSDAPRRALYDGDCRRTRGPPHPIAI
jgi:hypothetical protein